MPVWAKRAVLAFFLALAVAVVFGPRAGRRAAPAAPGDPAPSFDLPTLDGPRVRLADLRGKVVFLNFWATWCPPCVEEMPAVQRLADRLRGSPFTVLGVSVDADGAKKVRDFLREHHLTFPVALDPESRVAKGLYGTTGVPETFVVDRAGTIVGKYVGPRAWDDPRFVHEIELFLGPVGGRAP